MSTTSTQEVVFNVASQSLVFDCEDGRPTSITSVTVYARDVDDSSTAEAATTGTATIDVNPNTTITAAAGPAETDPTALTVTSGTGVTIGRAYRLTEDGTGVYEDVEVKSVSGTAVTLRQPLKNNYTSGSTFVSCRTIISVADTWTADISNLSPAFDPNPHYRVRWVIVIGGGTRVYERSFDLVRYTTRHGVTPLDVDRAHPGWLDMLPPDYQADQGHALIERAFESVKFELYGDNKADQAIRNPELVARLVIQRCPLQMLEDGALRGVGDAVALAVATAMFRQIYDQTLRSPVAAMDEVGGGAAFPARPRPLWVR